jgi:hypothetical protein
VTETEKDALATIKSAIEGYNDAWTVGGGAKGLAATFRQLRTVIAMAERAARAEGRCNTWLNDDVQCAREAGHEGPHRSERVEQHAERARRAELNRVADNLLRDLPYAAPEAPVQVQAAVLQTIAERLRQARLNATVLAAAASAGDLVEDDDTEAP